MELIGFTINTQFVAENPVHSAFSGIGRKNVISLIAEVVANNGPKAEDMLDAYSDKGIEHTRYINTRTFSLPFSTLQDRNLKFYGALL